MGNKSKKKVYWAATGLLTVMLVMTIANSLFNPEFSLRFARLGYPTYFIAPLMTLKVFGLIAIWTNAWKTLKEWAYTGFSSFLHLP